MPQAPKTTVVECKKKQEIGSWELSFLMKGKTNNNINVTLCESQKNTYKEYI